MAKPFSVPRLWSGETVVIAGSGPSLTQTQLDRVRGHARLIVVNDAYLLAPWADWLHGCDSKWWIWHRDRGALKFDGIRTTLIETVPDGWGVGLLRPTGKTGFDPDPACVRTGANGVYQAMHSAIHAGAARIVLVGVDMKRGRGGRSHFFGEHPDGRVDDHASVMLPHFPTLQPALTERGIEVINCTPGSALTCFPMGNLDEVLP
ncbi:MAG TPA: hypothetical protein VD860_16940 [Azospirillum sp.]|nr:hypothetical protein [Azospirillum sp.]